jgi:hypothetical protein
LNWLKSDAFIEMINQPQERQSALINVQSIQSLVKTTIIAFENTAAKLDDEIKTFTAKSKIL